MKIYTPGDGPDQMVELPETVSRPSPSRGSLLVVDPCRLFREGVAEILRQAHFEVAATSATIDDALMQLGTISATIDLLIVGLDARDAEPQLAALPLLRDWDARTKTVLLLPSCTAEILMAAVLSCVNGVVLKDVSGTTLIATLDLVMRGQHVLPFAAALQILARLQPAGVAPGARPEDVAPERPRVTEDAGQPETKTEEFANAAGAPHTLRSFSLSDRETQILQCLVEGCANKLIARRLGIAEATVKVHIKGLLRKINVSNRTQAAIWALNHSVTTQFDQRPAPAAIDLDPGDRAHSLVRLADDPVPDITALYSSAINLLMPTHA